MDNRKVAVIVGSLRRGSFSRMVANAMCGLHSDLDCAIVEIGKLPLYNPDREEEGPPREWIDFREQVRSRDAVLFVTPEYNRSLPGNLKNAIDVGSRPYGQSVWSKKPAAIVSVSPGALGAFGANHHLRQCLVFLDMPTLQQPEAYVGAISSKLDSDGSLANADTREFLAKYMEAFARWIQMTGTHPGFVFYFALSGAAGSFDTSRASCCRITVALRFAASFLIRSIDATVCARS